MELTLKELEDYKAKTDSAIAELRKQIAAMSPVALELFKQDTRRAIAEIKDTITESSVFDASVQPVFQLGSEVLQRENDTTPTSLKLVYFGDRGTDAVPGGNRFGVHAGNVYLDDAPCTNASSFTFYPNSFVVTGNTCGWIDIDKAANSWTFNTGESFPEQTTGHIIVRFWSLTWSTDHVSATSIYREGDLRAYSDGSVEATALSTLTWDAANLRLAYTTTTFKTREIVSTGTGFVQFELCAE